ncbi:MAG: DUF4157 domain-containing protein [Rubrivivax sp.]|nr:MAG: DUF4157 domain-containing protein [Rubrivivax sp.]
MKDTTHDREPTTAPSAAAQREPHKRGGQLSTQLAASPRQLAQRRLVLGSTVQRAEGDLNAKESGAAQLHSESVQRRLGSLDEEDEPGAAQLHAEPTQRQENRTGMPNSLKAGIESLSGMDMSDVRVHRNSSQPAQLNALAYAQGNDIHLAPGQEQHLPHEAWHVVQQRQGRVQATTQMAGVGVNDDVGLESEADAMGGRAVQMMGSQASSKDLIQKQRATPSVTVVIQRQVNSGLLNAASLTNVNWLNLLGTGPLNSHAYNSQPTITSGQGAHHDTYLLVWYGAITFNDGTVGDMHMHMHEGVHDPDALSGGGAWVDGGAAGHGANIDGLNRLKATCVAWINEAYDSECRVA